MNSTVRDIDHQSAAPDPLVVFRCRAEARADLVAAGLYELQEAVDGLRRTQRRRVSLRGTGKTPCKKF